MEHAMKQYPGDVSFEIFLEGRGVRNFPAAFAIGMDALIQHRVCPFTSTELSTALEILGAGEWNGGHSRPEQVPLEGPPAFIELKTVLSGLKFDEVEFRTGTGITWKNALVRSFMYSATGDN